MYNIYVKLVHVRKQTQRRTIMNSKYQYQFSDVTVLWNCRQNCSIVVERYQ